MQRVLLRSTHFATSTQSPAMSDLLLVTGASGQLGRRVLHHLLNTLHVPARRLVAATRRPESLADLAAQGVTVRQLDFEEPSTLAAALAGVSRMLLVSTDAIDRPGRRLQQHLAAVAAAVQAGVRHVVYTSMPRPEPGSPIPFAPDHHGTEQALAASALEWTVLRNNWYMENLFMNLPQVLASGQWFTAAGDGRIAHVARDDCARAAAVALAASNGGRQVFNLTGGVARSTAEIAHLATEVLGKPVQVVPVPPAALEQGLKAAGVPDFLVPVLVAFDVNTAQGRVAEVSPDLPRLTGTPAQDLRDFLVANRAALGG
jgi:NAD(P)H dehydrogenase (quinone)